MARNIAGLPATMIWLIQLRASSRSQSCHLWSSCLPRGAAAAASAAATDASSAGHVICLIRRASITLQVSVARSLVSIFMFTQLDLNCHEGATAVFHESVVWHGLQDQKIHKMRRRQGWMRDGRRRYMFFPVLSIWRPVLVGLRR